MSSTKDAMCFVTPDITKQEHQALQALHQGVADDYQQRLALMVIVNKFSRAQDLPYIPGSFDQSSILVGRAFVGQKILKYLNLPIGKIKEGDQ